MNAYKLCKIIIMYKILSLNTDILIFIVSRDATSEAMTVCDILPRIDSIIKMPS